MAYNFPNSPAIDDSFTPTDGPTWVWNGTAWVQVGTGGPVGPAGPTGPQGIPGPTGAPGAAGSSAWADITGKPSTFPPTVPIPQSDIISLTSDLAGKLNRAGDTMTSKLGLVLGGSVMAPLNVPPAGAAPASPVHGDMWLLSDGRLQWRITTFTLTAVDAFSQQTIGGWKTFTDKVNLAPQGSTPTGLANGDVWTTSLGMYVRINGGTVGPLAKAVSGSPFYLGYLFNASTTPPPAAGGARLNNGTHSAATILYISYTTEDGVDLKTYFAQRVKISDQLYLQDRDDPTKWNLYEINAAFTDNTTYASIPVTWKAGSGNLPAQRIIVTREGAGAAAGGVVDWSTITGKPATFPPTLPIAQSGITALVSDLAAKAPLVSPFFTGSPQAPTAAFASNNSLVANTQYVDGTVAAKITNKITVASTAPSSPATNDVWIDTT